MRTIFVAVATLFVFASFVALPSAQGADEEISAASADTGGDQKKKAPAAAAKTGSGPKRLQAVVRGFYVEAQVGAGYMLLSANVPDPPAGSSWEQGSELLGIGGMVGLNIGFDIVEMIAIQILGGTLMVDSTRTDRVRDLAMIYGMAGVRVALGITERLDLVIAAAGGVATADNLVEEAEIGFGIMGNVGLEYYVHVRHFSIGLEVALFMPIVNDVRMFLGLSPTIKYTF